MVPGQASPAQVVGTHKTVEGGDVTVTGSGSDLKVNDASVVCGGVQTANATVYMIDTVLMPPTTRFWHNRIRTQPDRCGRAASVFVHLRFAADGSTVASILRIRLSRTVSTMTANSRRSANASNTGSPAGPLTSVAPWPR